METILALDQGTTVSKAAVYAANGRLLGLGRASVTTRFGRMGRAVQDPLELLEAQRLAMRRALRAAGEPRVDAAGVSSQRSTFVVWDRHTGRPVAPAPTWQSTEASRICEELDGSSEAVRERTGLPLSPHYSASKLALLFETKPLLKRLAESGDLMFGNVATWLIWNLTGGAVHATDPTHAARTLLFNLERLRWDRWLMDLFGVPDAIMPKILPSLGDYGSLRIAGKDVPIRACLGDQQAALIGVSGLSGQRTAGTALVNYGTGAFVLIPTGERPERREGMLTSLLWTSAKERCYVLEGTINAAGSTLDWLRREMRAPAPLDAMDRLCRKSAGDTQLLPSFWGLGSAYTTMRDSTLPAVMVSTGAPVTIADMTRAGVEAIAHMVAVVLERGAGDNRRVRRLVATGSLAGLPYLMQFQASLLAGVAVSAGAEPEATLAGVARAAATSAGIRWRHNGARRLPAIATTARERGVAMHRHREWRRLIAMARIWKEVAEAYP